LLNSLSSDAVNYLFTAFCGIYGRVLKAFEFRPLFFAAEVTLPCLKQYKEEGAPENPSPIKLEIRVKQKKNRNIFRTPKDKTVNVKARFD
jgi:hypothetical protein